MTTPPPVDRLADADANVRLQAAMAAGTYPGTVSVDRLVERCAVEPDFFVRDSLTWALTRQPADRVVARLLAELDSVIPQARSQALHTLSKIGDRRAWPAVHGALLHDTDDETARSAWRAAVALVPTGDETALAAELVLELGRRDREAQRSLSRALVALGEAGRTLITDAATTGSIAARAHAAATRRMLDDPDADFTVSLEDAARIAIMTDAPQPPPDI